MGKNLVMVISQKGGVGKSTFTRGLVETLRLERDDVAAYDADGAVGQLLQYLGKRDESGKLAREQTPYDGVGAFDVRKERERGALVNVLDDEPELAIVDLPGGSFQAVSEVLGGTRKIVDAFMDAGYGVYVVLVITQIKAGVHAVRQCIESFGPGVHYVVVKNLAFADEEDFVVFDGIIDKEHGDPERGYRRYGKAKDELLAVGGEAICLPKISGLTYGLLDYQDMSFTRGMASDSGLTFQQREHCKNFLKEFRQQIGRCSLRDLLPGKLPSKVEY
jgi:hypothetical protein